MQDNKQENQFLDDDILRCKADLRKAFDAMVGSISEKAAIEESVPEPKEAPVIEAEDELPPDILDDERPAEAVAAAELGQESINVPPIQILSFDAIQRDTLEIAEPSPDKPVSDSPILEKDKIAPGETPIEPHAEQVKVVKMKVKEIVQQAQKKILSIMAQKDQLQHQVNKTISENTHLQDELQSGRQQLEQQQQAFEKEMDAFREEIQTLLSQREYAARQLEDTKSQLEQKNSDRDTLLEDIRELEKELHDKSEILSNQQQQLDSANEKLMGFSQLQEVNLKLKKELDQLGDQQPEFASERQQLQQENQRLLEDIDQLRAQTKDFHAISEQAERLRKELEKTDIILSQERAHIRQLTGTLKELEEELDVVRHERQDLAERLSTKEQELEQALSEHKRLHDEYNGFRNQENRDISDMTFQLEDHREKMRNIEDQLEQVRHEYEAFQTQANGELSILTEKNQQLSNESRTLFAEAAALKERLQHADQQIDRIQTIEIDLKNANDALSMERLSRQELQQQYEQLQSTASQLHREKDELVAHRQQQQAMESQLRQEIEKLQESVGSFEDIGSELAKAKNENDQLRQQNRQLQEQVTEITVSEENDFGDDSSLEDDSAIVFADPNENQNNEIPVFNLADQIMEEQRRAAANRRQRPEPAVSAPSGNSISDVIRQYVGSANTAAEMNKRAGIEHHPWSDPSLTPFQQDILREIVRKDMAFYGRKNPNAVNYSSMKN